MFRSDGAQLWPSQLVSKPLILLKVFLKELLSLFQLAHISVSTENND